MGILKSKIAKLRTQLLEPEKGPGSEATGFEVVKYGDARIALIGFPSVGKSTALSLLTGTESEAANYEFTTLTCIPGIIHYKGTKMQLLDLPGIIEGAANGKGRGRQVIAVAKSADLVLMMLGMCVAVCCSVLQCVREDLRSISIASPPAHISRYEMGLFGKIIGLFWRF